MKKYIKLSELFKYEIKPFLFGVFLSRIMEENINGHQFFYAYTAFRSSKAVFESDFSLKNYAPKLAEKMNLVSGHKNWYIETATSSNVEIRFYVLNDIKISKQNFYRFMYQKLMASDWLLDVEFNEAKKSFIRGFIECRGSVDTTAKLLAQDYFYDNRTELKKALILTDMMDLPCEYANFNSRALQPQYVLGINKRNPQFRINLFYYASRIGFLNEYKAKVFDNSYVHYGSHVIDGIVYYRVDVPVPRTNNSFISYLNFFTNNIYEKNLNDSTIKLLRDKLGFRTSEDSGKKVARNQSIINLYREISEDKCAVCGTTKTFLNKKTGRQHFEIHHVISFANGQECDNIANLVKLCPTCHDSLKRGATSKGLQIRNIIKILNEHPEIYEFADAYFTANDINELAEKIWENLG